MMKRNKVDVSAISIYVYKSFDRSSIKCYKFLVSKQNIDLILQDKKSFMFGS